MTNPERWRRLSALFDELVELDASGQAHRIDALMREDAALAQELAELLDADRAGDDALDGSLAAQQPTLMDRLAADRSQAHAAGVPGKVVGPFRLLRMLGKGGMGEVWLAERAGGEFHQQVALKLLKLGMDSADILMRFERERRILAALEHPYIARFVDGGLSDDGLPWFAMEYVDGEAITDHARRMHLDARARVTLMYQVCEAVAHAQSRLVIHRDLKPSNILIDTEGRPRLLDFGIAKLLQEGSVDEQTRTQMRAMSPAYAAPEQVLDQPIGTPADTYALGVVLYELLTGTLPQRRDGQSLEALSHQVSSQEVPRPALALAQNADAPLQLGLDGADIARQRRALQGDLGLIVLTALRTEPDRRYRSASALGEDLQAWLDARPVRARPDSAGYRTRRFLLRHRAAVAAAFLVMVSLVGGLGLALWQAGRADAEARRAEAQAERAERSKNFFAGLFHDSSPVRQKRGAELTVRELIDEAAARLEVELDGMPHEQADIGATLAFAMADLGDRATALAMTERAIERLRMLHPQGSPGLAFAIHQRAGMLSNLGRPQEGEVAAREALAMYLSLPGDHALDVIRVRTALLVAARFQGRHAEMVEQSEAVLRDREAVLGVADHPALAVDWFNLGVAYQHTGRFADAAAAARRADALLQADPEAPESRRAWTLLGLGAALTLDGQPEAAMTAFEEGEAIAVRTLGAGHALVAQALLGSAYAARDLGRPDEAERRLRRALDIAAANGDESEARVRTALGELCLEQGRQEEAIELLRQGLTDLDLRGQGRDPQTLKLHTVLALALARAGHLEEALAETEPAIGVLETLDVARGRWLGEAALSHAEVLLHAGRAEDAAHWRRVGESELESIWAGAHPRRLALLAERRAP